MIDLVVGDATPRALVLEPRVERSEHGPAQPLVGPISLGGPVAIPLTPARLDGDRELASFVEADTAFRYDLVHLAGTFVPAEDEPLERVWVKVTLSRVDQGEPPLPIAWSMKPDRLEDTGASSTAIKLGGSLKIADVGLQLGADRGTQHVLRDVRLEALYELQSNPTWVLERTKGSAIRGTQRFALVLRTPRDTRATMSIDVGAVIQRRRFGFLTHRARLADTPGALVFTIEP